MDRFVFPGGVALIAALAAFPASPAHAAGFDYPDNGARALGMAAAHTGMPDDGSAIYYNPAGLGAMTGMQLQLDTGIALHHVDFQRTDATGGALGNPVSNSGGAFLAPMGAFTYTIFDGLTLALGAYGPPAVGKYNYPDPNGVSANTGCGPSAKLAIKACSSTRYMLIDNNIFVVYPSLSVGWHPMKNLYVGGSLQPIYATFDFEQNIWVDIASAGTMNENPDQDVRVHVKTSNVFKSVTGVLGVIVQATDGVNFGISYRPRFDMKSSGTFDTSPQNKDNLPLTQTGNKIELTIPFPDVLRAGADVRYGNVHGALDVVYETWGRVDHFLIHPTETIGFKLGAIDAPPLKDQQIARNWQNSFSARLGGEYTIDLGNLKLTPRAGFLYESSAIPEERTDIGFANWQRYSIHAGLTGGFRGYAITVGYARVIQPSLSVRDSQVKAAALAADSTKTVDGSVIGNGNFSASYDLISIGLRVDFKNL